MPRVFEEQGIRFVYPDNWQLENQDADQGQAQMVTVASPEGAFWCVSVLPADLNMGETAQAILEGLKAEYQDLDAEAVVEEILDHETLGYDVNFFCLDLTSTAHIRTFQTAYATYTVLWQAEDRELQTLVPVFDAITASLIQTAYGAEKLAGE